MTAIVKRLSGNLPMAKGSVKPFAFSDPEKGLRLGFDVMQDHPPNKSMQVIMSREDACEIVAAWVKGEQEYAALVKREKEKCV